MINLSRTLQVQCIDVSATVAVEQDRPEFLAIVQLAKDCGGELTSHQLQQELLLPLPEQACRLALIRCVALNLLDENGASAKLTELGSEALERGTVLVPKQGIWRFYLIDDPLIPYPVIHMERIKTEESHKQVSKNKKGEKDSRTKVSTPPLLSRNIKTPVQRSLVDSKLRQIQDVSEKGHEHTLTTVQLELTWPAESAPTIRLTGKLPQSDQQIDTAVNSDLTEWTYLKLWTELASKASGIPIAELSSLRERRGVRVIPVFFENTTAESRQNFQMNFEVPEIRLHGLGEFLRSTLEHVDICPATDRDAQNWCEWLQWHKITDYVTPGILRQQAEDILPQFPLYQPKPLEPDAILKFALNNNNCSASRYVLAPADLGLWS
ncbi:hypothetical protein [Terasakiella pusilla]|uniref:hypothetical protein n=1 Tax=Terasakiella pusilla TaxID=64973 RepID=UPI003AA7D5AC